MSKLFELFSALDITVDHSKFDVADVPSFLYHKIGISVEGYPVFFLRCKEDKNTLVDKVLQLLKIEFNRKCLLRFEDRSEEGLYTLITLMSDNEELQNYFLEILYILVSKLPPMAESSALTKEVNLLLEIFKGYGNPALKSVQGVWSELFLIERASETDYLARSWHSSVFSKFDFNDGVDKIEVKSTIKDRRIHRFSSLQLVHSKISQLAIASVMMSETGIGINIFDLRNRIYNKLEEKELILKVDALISKTLGRSIDLASDVFFDYNSALDSLKFFNVTDIPNLTGVVPLEISNIEFDCDLSNVSPIMENSGSKLLKSAIAFNL